MDSAATHAALSTPLCDLLGVRYPIIQAPMARGWTTPEMVSAVSHAGGFGVLAGAGVPPSAFSPKAAGGRIGQNVSRPWVYASLAPCIGEHFSKVCEAPRPRKRYEIWVMHQRPWWRKLPPDVQ